MQKTSLGRLTIDRLSLSPIGAIVGSIHAAVEHVGRDHGLNHVVSKCVPLLPQSVCPSFLRACIIKKVCPSMEHISLNILEMIFISDAALLSQHFTRVVPPIKKRT